ncbi:MAG: hypothetical protein ACLUEC_07925 [Coprococcus sp.]
MPKATQDEVFAGTRAFVKREFSKLIGFLIVALSAVGLVFNAGSVKDVLLELFNKIIGDYWSIKLYCFADTRVI